MARYTVRDTTNPKTPKSGKQGKIKKNKTKNICGKVKDQKQQRVRPYVLDVVRALADEIKGTKTITIDDDEDDDLKSRTIVISDDDSDSDSIILVVDSANSQVNKPATSRVNGDNVSFIPFNETRPATINSNPTSSTPIVTPSQKRSRRVKRPSSVIIEEAPSTQRKVVKKNNSLQVSTSNDKGVSWLSQLKNTLPARTNPQNPQSVVRQQGRYFAVGSPATKAAGKITRNMRKKLNKKKNSPDDIGIESSSYKKKISIRETNVSTSTITTDSVHSSNGLNRNYTASKSALESRNEIDYIYSNRKTSMSAGQSRWDQKPKQRSINYIFSYLHKHKHHSTRVHYIYSTLTKKQNLKTTKWNSRNKKKVRQDQSQCFWGPAVKPPHYTRWSVDTQPSCPLSDVPADLQNLPLREIIVDGQNVAHGHGGSAGFSPLGIKLVVEFFQRRGHRVIAILPNNCMAFDRDNILQRLENQKILTYTPSRKVDGKVMQPYDDRFIIQYASDVDGVVVSRDQYRDLMDESPQFKETIVKRLLMFTFIGDRVYFPKDPFGKRGPSLERLLRFDRSFQHPCNSELEPVYYPTSNPFPLPLQPPNIPPNNVNIPCSSGSFAPDNLQPLLQFSNNMPPQNMIPPVPPNLCPPNNLC